MAHGADILPEVGDGQPDDHFLLERYVRAEGEETEPLKLRAYYALKPFLPRGLQIGLRRVYARRQAQQKFPRWPIEPLLVERRDAELIAQLRRGGRGRLPIVGYWPHGHRFAYVLTHDVEGAVGVENIRRVREVERRHGIVSSWNFCAEQYPIPDRLFDELRAEGCEIGLHGIDHECKLFGTRERFEEELPKIHAYLRDWDIDGFRSPALHRNADWMPELGARYDSSYPDTDPFAPQPGGCCSVLPFFNGDLVELPVTMVQDHDLWEILQRPTIDLWREKATWLREVHGLVNVIIHPDYLLEQERLDQYGELLAFLNGLEGGWHALPRDVAGWWRDRAALSVAIDASGGATIPGGDAAGATVAWVREDAGRAVLELG